MSKKVNIYAIYASEDKGAMQNLLQYLKSYEQYISIWHDDPIVSGQTWKSSDITRQDKTDIFLLLISNAFMYSEFVKQLEFKKVIDRYKANQSKVVPVILEKCPWDIDFEADEYTFNFKELEVLPEGAKPVADWQSSNEALEKVADHIKSQIESISGIAIQEEPVDDESEESTEEDQLAIPFSAKAVEAKSKAEAKERLEKEEIAKKKALQEEKRIKEAADKKVAEEKKLLKAEADKKLEEEKRREEEIEEKRLAALEQKLQEEAAEAESEKRIQDELEKRAAEAAREKNLATETSEEVEEIWEEENNNAKKRILVGLSIAAVALIGVFLFSGNDDSEAVEDEPIVPMEETVVTEESINKDEAEITTEEPKKATMNAAASLSKLTVGDSHESGIVFTVDDSGQNGMIAHIDDFGPMTWSDAMNIHEQLGEGWRVPTFDELRLMYKTIGQGADNTGEFADDFYWSATPFDENQAKLIRFRDGNTSYHYNSRGTHRKFLVRAIRDFDR